MRAKVVLLREFEGAKHMTFVPRFSRFSRYFPQFFPTFLLAHKNFFLFHHQWVCHEKRTRINIETAPQTPRFMKSLAGQCRVRYWQTHREGLLRVERMMARHSGGWVKLHRKILHSWIGRDSAAFSIFCTLVIWANHKEGSDLLRGQLVTLGRGQVATSPKELALQLKLGAKLVERRLEALEKDGAIVQEVSSKGRIITLVKYVRYQDSNDDSVEQRGNRKGAQGERRGSAGEHSEEIQELPSGEEVTSNPPISPPQKGGSSKRDIHDDADERGLEILEALMANTKPDDAKEQLDPKTWQLVNKAFPGGWNFLGHSLANAICSGKLETFKGSFRRDLRTAARKLAKSQSANGPPDTPTQPSATH